MEVFKISYSGPSREDVNDALIRAMESLGFEFESPGYDLEGQTTDFCFLERKEGDHGNPS